MISSGLNSLNALVAAVQGVGMMFAPNDASDFVKVLDLSLSFLKEAYGCHNQIPSDDFRPPSPPTHIASVHCVTVAWEAHAYRCCALLMCRPISLACLASPASVNKC